MKYLSKERLLLKLSGVSFNDNESIFYKAYSFLLIFGLNFMFPTLMFTDYFIEDFEVVADMSVYCIASYLAVGKALVLIRNRKQIRKVLERLEEEPFSVNLERGGEQEEKLNKECLWITNAQTLLYWTVGFATIYSNHVYSIIRRLRSKDYRDWIQPFSPLSIFNAKQSPSYEILLFYQCLASTTICCHLYTVDLLVASVLAHISYQFRMLQNNLRCIIPNCYKEMQKDKSASGQALSLNCNISSADIDTSTIPWKYLHKHLKKAVQYHIEITNLAKDMEHVFSTLLLTIFLGTMGMICFPLFSASVVQDNMRIAINVLDIATSGTQVLCVCYWGEQILFESQQVGRAAYEANFVGTDLRFQKGLAMVIRRSQNSTKLTAGKFTDLCLATFTWIVRASYSSFMVIRGTTSNEMQAAHQ